MFLTVFLIAIDFGVSQGKIIYTDRGPVKGNLLHIGEHTVYSFKNIPYAKPPVGNFRFQLPKRQQRWYSEDDLQRNTEVLCPQNSFYEDQILDDVILGQEDCLVLDVYVRESHHVENISLPVLVYFHGGRFHSGSKEDYGPDYLLRYNDIILVVPNYRLGILGFLSFQDTALPGNLGIWDQNAALKWVYENIDRFGGDAERVTIAGHEAGAASVGLHILAPASHEYFQRALSASGTALSPWLIDRHPSFSKAFKVVDHLRCPIASKKEMLACLKTAPLSDILEVQGEMQKVAFLPTTDQMAENPIIPFPPKVLYHKNYQKNVNYLIGYTENEATYEVSKEFPNVLKYQHLDKMIQYFLRPHFRSTPNFETIAKAAKYHYLRGLMIPSFESLEPRMAKMMTDFLYMSPLEEVLKLQQKMKSDIFVYKFQSANAHYCGIENRRCFGNEFFVFNSSYFRNLQDADLKKIKTLSRIWGNFVKFGYPDVHEKWKPVKEDSELHFAEISEIIEPKINYRNDDSEFWITLVSELHAAENVTDGALGSNLESEHSNYDTWGAAGLVILCGVLCIALMGVVFITKRRTLTMSIVPVSSPKDIKFSTS